MNDISTVAIREEIKRARIAKKLSQTDLANLCSSISNTDISAYESGSKNPSLNKLEIISKALGKEWKLT